MDIEDLQQITSQLPAVTEDIKWGHDLCFCIGGKMFLVVGLGQSPVSASFKVLDEEFEEISSRPGFMPAPYVARYKWVLTTDINHLNQKEWVHYIRQSYELVKNKLSKKILGELGIV